MINDTSYALQGVANFSGVKNVTITGKGRLLTHINCESKNVTGAGIAFVNSSNICLQNFNVTNCAAATISILEKKWLKLLVGNFSAIKINNCSNVNVLGIAVSQSRGQGLTLINTGSTVRLIDSHFINNSITYRRSTGGGLQIIFFGRNTPQMATSYTIANSVFQHNIASKLTCNSSIFFTSCSCERGGGIRIILANACKNISFALNNNSLENNKAIFAGAIQIYTHGDATNNVFNLSNNSFCNNTATCGGGALDVGYTTYTSKSKQLLYPMNNAVLITNSSFHGNTASLGGGLFVFASSVGLFKTYANNSFNCENCSFSYNKALGGSAAYIGMDSKNYGLQSIITTNFINCTIERNFIIANTTNRSSSIGSGAFFISTLPVTFSGSVKFLENNGTALYLDSTSVKFTSNCTVNFTNNSGYQGGAVALYGNSKFLLDNSSHFYFYNNTATNLGGAICVLSGSKQVYSYLGSCFLKLKNPHQWPKKLYFNFSGNSATAAGNDIFSTSISPCDKLCGFHMHRPLNANEHFFDFPCYGNFTFSDHSTNITKHVATQPSIVFINSSLDIIPGISTSLLLHQLDELGQDVNHLFPLTAKVQSSSMKTKVDPLYTVISNNTIVLLGRPGDTGVILLEGDTVRHTVQFRLSSCSPGFVLIHGKKCVCNVQQKGKLVIVKCEPNGSAAININYWAGYKNVANDTSQENLYTGLCLTQLCNHHRFASCNEEDRDCDLPHSGPELEKVICGENRQGRLCGRCVSGKVVYYHSHKFTCGNSTNCQYGVLIYIATELVPVTIIFLIILLFNISLTSGALYSFVFYVQIMSRLDVTAFGMIHIHDPIKKTVVDMFQTLLGIFAFEIENENLEFCILPTDSIMGLFMIKYATLMYAFVLVLATILILRVYSCYNCVKLCRRCGRRNIRGSIVDGLSAFLVLCYFQCAIVTSSILTPSILHGFNMHYMYVAMFDGEMEYLKGEHLWFAMPAFLCLAFILIPPPTILILEPILTKLFSLNCFTGCQVSWLYGRLRLKLMPFLDSFQACFKDSHRYFAGLYFLYRLIIPLLSIFVQTPEHYYGITACLFMVILLLHIFLQPHKQKWHNLLELSLFINIMFLLMISLYNYYIPDGIRLINVQLFLMSLSFAYIVVYTAVKIHQKYPIIKKCGQNSSAIDTDMSNDFPYRLLNDSNDDSN